MAFLDSIKDPESIKHETVKQPIYQEVFQASTERIESVGSVIL